MAGALVAGAVLSASLQALFDRLASRLIDSVWIQKDEEVLLKKLKASLVFAEAVLSDAEHKQITDPTAKGWLDQLEETVADAQNLLKAIEARDSPRRFRGGSKSKLLEDMLDRLEIMVRQKDAFGFIELGAQPLQTSPTTSLMQEPNIYGRDEDMEAILSLLLSDEAPGDPICVITIVGVPRIGKTTLAQSIYNDNSMEGYFDFRVWICVSNRLDVYSITKTILEAITMVSCDIKDLNLLQLRLREELIGRKLLLVLDDLCTEDCSEWNTLRSPWRFCAMASKIIVTTRSEITAAMTCTLPAYHLSPLPYEDCWLIFAQHAFDSGLGAPDPNLEAVGREIVKKCRGFPLVAKTLGVLFRSKPNHGEWNEILTESMWDASHDLNSFVQALSVRSGIGKWRKKLSERQHDDNFFPGVLNQFGGTFPYINIKRVWFSIFLVLWIMILSIVSALVYKTVKDYQTTKMKEALGSMCDKQAWMLQDQFAVYVNHLHALAMVAKLYDQQNATYTTQMGEALKGHMDNTTFKRPLLSGVVYAERAGLEDKRGQQWRIMHVTPQSEPSPIQEEYVPYEFREDDIAYKGPLLSSLGMITGEEDRHDVLKTGAVEKAVLSAPFRLFPSNRTGVILIYPVYRSKFSPSVSLEERIRATAGYIGGLFEFESLVESVLWELGSQTVLVEVYDTTNRPRSLMYGRNYVKFDRTMVHRRKLELGDPFRKYLMICRYRDEASKSWLPAIVAVLIVTIGLLAPCMLYAAAVHIVKLRQASLQIQGLEVQLQDANMAHSQLRADASEIKQPAYIIIQTLAMLLESELSLVQRSYTRIAQACGKRQIALVDRALESPNSPVITSST